MDLELPSPQSAYLPAEVDKVEAEVLARDIPPEDTYALGFRLYTPRFEALVDKLSVRKAKRMLKFLVTHPLNTKNYKLMEPFEKELFQIADFLLQAKYGMIIHTAVEFHKKKMEQSNGIQQEPNKETTQESGSPLQIEGPTEAPVHHD